MHIVNAKNNFVSRAEEKLEGAVRAFHYDFRGKIVLDIGSSTGGFTELALNLGAAKVIAVEKGTNQMKTPLRHNPRIELHEKTDIFAVITRESAATVTCSKEHKDSARAARSVSEGHATVAANSLIITDVDVILADVSFVSLTKILKYAKIHLARSNTDFLVMLKPQFEAKPYQLNKGVVKNEKFRREIIKNFELWLKQNDFVIIKKRDNDLAGRNGNLERFYYLKLAK